MRGLSWLLVSAGFALLAPLGVLTALRIADGVVNGLSEAGVALLVVGCVARFGAMLLHPGRLNLVSPDQDA